MEPTTPNAQGSDGQPVAVPTTPVAPAVPEGIQRRFDEMTAELHTARSQMDAVMQQNQQLLTMVQQPTAQVVAADPYADVDPALAGLLKNQQEQFTKQLTALQQSFASAMAPMQLQQHVAPGEDPRVVVRANELIRNWNQRGLQLSPTDALTFAAGELARQERTATLQQNAAKQQFNGLSASVLTGRREENVQPPVTQQPLPANYENMSPMDQMKVLEARGVHTRSW